MCGIAGIITFENCTQRLPNTDLVQKMCSALIHRGPDDEGYYSDTNVHLGMTRLAILDLRKGLYPLKNEDGTLLLFYNGEIYNFGELRSQLNSSGHKFNSATDGEVIVHAYEEWGPDCVKRFNGMWAFALWDANKERLFLSRDHFGIKPLYYAVSENFLCYASEIRALLSVPGIKTEPNEKLIYDFLVDGRVDHTEETFFTGIFRIMPAHYATLTLSGSLEKKRYWSMDSITQGDAATTLVEASEKVRKLFIDAVRLRLISDVPVGTCLSGGLDSSSIVATIARLKNEEKKSIGKKLQTFSACYPDDPIDESRFANLVTKISNAEPNIVYPGTTELWSEIPELIRTQEEPFVSSSIYAQWKIMQTARSHRVTVLLDGQGSDEVMAGYIEYFKPYITDLFRRRKVMTALREATRSLDLTFPLFLRSLRIVRGIDSTIGPYLNEEFASVFRSRRSDHRMSRILDPDLTPSKLLNDDTTCFILPGLLRYEDKNSMHFSIETRLPFLDPRLVEYVASLPMCFKIRGGWTKRVFRDAMQGILPKEIRRRRSKIGFETPQQSWLLELSDKIDNLLSSEVKSSKFVNIDALLELLRTAKKKRLSAIDSSILWRCVILELWLREFFAQSNLTSQGAPMRVGKRQDVF
jgi:asparagine synthase (glutamine-hydrolysing)